VVEKVGKGLGKEKGKKRKKRRERGSRKKGCKERGSRKKGCKERVEGVRRGRFREKGRVSRGEKREEVGEVG
jgi:hypothetical protein